MITVLLFFTCIYVILIAALSFGITRVPVFKSTIIPPKTCFSIIIPFRNEDKNLPYLLTSITALHYPKHHFEIILIDDNSTDTSVVCIENFKIKHPKISIHLITNKIRSHSPKKDAINLGVKQAKYEWIVSTDADCIVPKYWLTLFDVFIQCRDTVFISAPVTYRDNNSFFKNFQLLDFLSLIGATIGSFGLNIPFLCNGANLAYKKSAFTDVNGFSGNTHIGSGDDVFLLEKMRQKYPKQVHYLKNKHAIVTTQPENSLNALLHQRKRWAAKASHYKGIFPKLLGLTVLGTNGILLITFTLALLNSKYLPTLTYCFITKAITDIILIYQASTLFKQTHVLKSFVLSSFLYPVFSIYVALTSQLIGYTWKNRSFKK